MSLADAKPYLVLPAHRLSRLPPGDLLEWIVCLVSSGMSVDRIYTCNDVDATLLHYACSIRGAESAINYLLAEGARVDIPDSCNRYAIEMIADPHEMPGVFFRMAKSFPQAVIGLPGIMRSFNSPLVDAIQHNRSVAFIVECLSIAAPIFGPAFTPNGCPMWVAIDCYNKARARAKKEDAAAYQTHICRIARSISHLCATPTEQWPAFALDYVLSAEMREKAAIIMVGLARVRGRVMGNGRDVLRMLGRIVRETDLVEWKGFVVGAKRQRIV